MTALIDRLESKGLVRRMRDPRGDRRRVLVKLTPKLGRTIGPLFESLNLRMRALCENYSAGQVDTLRDFLMSGAREMREEAAELNARRT